MDIDIFLYIFLCFLHFIMGQSADTFCGNLTIYKQKWFTRTATTISSQTTINFKECLNTCCSIPNCNAVTFIGFIGNSTAQSSTNCMLFTCRENCVVVERDVPNEGVVSVFINKSVGPPNIIQPPPIAELLPTAPPFLELQTTTPTTETPNVLRSELTPVWAVGIAIVIAIVCIGTNVALLSAWLCYRRQRTRMRRCEITTIKTPTLHAFNPTT